MTRLQRCAALIIVGCMSACHGEKPNLNAQMQQTTLDVRAPLNLGSTVTVFSDGRDIDRERRKVVREARLDDAGNVHFDLFEYQGDMIVEVTGGHHADPATG